jgi:hypothetical protein
MVAIQPVECPWQQHQQDHHYHPRQQQQQQQEAVAWEVSAVVEQVVG